MNKKQALFAFNGDPICFVHVLLNTLDLHAKGFDVKLIIEGSATKLIAQYASGEAPFKNFYDECLDKGLIDCVCRACTSKMGSLEAAEQGGLPVCGDMSGHPSMAGYLESGYSIITF